MTMVAWFLSIIIYIINYSHFYLGIVNWKQHSLYGMQTIQTRVLLTSGVTKIRSTNSSQEKLMREERLV